MQESSAFDPGSDDGRTGPVERESKSLLYKIFHASPSPITISRLSDARLVEVNEEWAAFTGYAVADSVGKTTDELNLWVNGSRYAEIKNALTDRKSVHDEEIDIRTKSGEVRTVVLSAQVIEVEGRDCVLKVMTDITDRKRMEHALLEAKERAGEMSELKATFLTNITHEIRTPLTVILGFTSILRQGVRSEYQRFINLIERSGRRLLLMLDSMLDLAQLESGTLEIDSRTHNVSDIVESAVAAVRPLTAEKGLDLNLTVPQGRHYANVDHAVLTRVLSNLLDNAVKFTDEGRIDVEVSRTDDDILFVVRDTGIGIEEKFLPHVFDAFVQESTGLDRTHQGSGLGLSVSKRLVELMGGTMTLSSRKNDGSVFSIRLPASADAAGKPQ